MNAYPAVLVLHRLNLIHTDLKPENILLVSNAYYQTGERVRRRTQITRALCLPF